MGIRKKHPLNPAEWTAIGNWAVHTRNLVTAAKIAARIRKLGGRGTIDGIEWMGLAAFEQHVTEADASSVGDRPAVRRRPSKR